MSPLALETEQSMSNYQWYLEGDSVFGADQFIFSPLQTGNYTVSYLDDNDCFSISNEFLYELLAINNESRSVRQLLKIIDVLGRELASHMDIENTILFYIYDDGLVEKRIVID
tara:strand:- start:83 stop:421 length:339 start_codon:yes stop_codon:yes gene_type:complete